MTALFVLAVAHALACHRAHSRRLALLAELRAVPPLAPAPRPATTYHVFVTMPDGETVLVTGARVFSDRVLGANREARA